MYLDFFRLREQPFGVTPNPAFLYLSQTHREALEALRSDLVTDRGFMALVGEPGLGKTTLLYKLLDDWRQTARVVFLFQTQCDSRDFFRYLLAELGVDTESMGLVAMHHKLNHILLQEVLAGRRFILIVDEAQNLDDSVFETVRGLSNFETPNSKLLNIVLAGQSQLADRLAAPGLRQLRQRIGPLNRLQPLTAPETAEYIQHRLGLAGHCGEGIFTLGAVQAIAKASQGTPRTINNMCHQALCAAALARVPTVNLAMAQNVIARFEGRSIKQHSAPLAAPAKAPAPVPVPVSTPLPTPSRASGPAMRPAPPSAAHLSYRSPRESTAKLRGFAAIASCVLLLLGASYAFPSVRSLARQAYDTLTERILHRSPDSGAASSPPSSPASELNWPAYDRGSQDAPVITVAPRTGQSIKELSDLYIGRFDSQLYRQIYKLNPDVKDLDYLQAGQLIRLPLPSETSHKDADTAEIAQTTQPHTWDPVVATLKELFSGTNR
jgi:type II secretory pathway predicted ATPase ExeA